MRTYKASQSSSGRPWTRTLRSDVQVTRPNATRWFSVCKVFLWWISCFATSDFYLMLFFLSWKVPWICGGKSELPLVAAHYAGEVPRHSDSRLCGCYLQELHQEELAHCESPNDTSVHVDDQLYVETLIIVVNVCTQLIFLFFWYSFLKVEDEPNKVSDQDRTAIKANIVNLMLSSPEQIQKQVQPQCCTLFFWFERVKEDAQPSRCSSYAFPQLSDAISIIGREDFPQKWPDLLTEMVTRFRSGDFHIINGVLRTAHSLFKRYGWLLEHL